MIAAQRQFEEFKQTVMDRFASVNEFRGSLADLSKMMATRIELIALGEKFQPVIDRNSEEINHRLQKETFDVKMGEIAKWQKASTSGATKSRARARVFRPQPRW